MRFIFRPYFALLLLYLTPTLLPEAWILELHTHQHTTKEPAFAPHAKRQPGKALLTTKHTHCQTEQFYNVAYQPAPLAAGGSSPPPAWACLPAAGRARYPCCSAAALRRTALRGPPRA